MGKNILPTRLLKKILDDQKSPTPLPPPPQELNGWPLRPLLYGEKMDQFRFLINCPPTPPLS